MMIGSTILKIYRIDGEVNSTIVSTTTGFYLISNGFFKVDESEIDGYKEFNNPDKKGRMVVEVRASMEFTFIKLSDNDLLVYHVDTPFLEVTPWEKVKDDEEFLDWYYNDLQELTNEVNYAVIKT